MVGLAVSSYDGAGEVAGYQGQFIQYENCIGRIRQQDDRGATYAYAAILRSDGSGYAYLQTQGDDLTVALVEKSESSTPRASLQWQVERTVLPNSTDAASAARLRPI